MSTDFVPQPQNDDRFLEEAIDLLLFLEQELPNYTKDSNPGTALALMEAASSLHSIAIAVELDAIAIVAAALEEIFQLLHQYRAVCQRPHRLPIVGRIRLPTDAVDGIFNSLAN